MNFRVVLISVLLAQFLVLIDAAARRNSSTTGKSKRRASTTSRKNKGSANAANVKLASADFAFNILRKLAEKLPNKSTVFSPATMSTAWALTYGGARGKTAEELRAALGGGSGTATDIHNHYSTLHGTLHRGISGVTLKAATRLFVKPDVPVESSFKSFVKKNYNGDFQQGDYDLDTINQFAANATDDRIKQLLSSLDPNSVMVLINAAYFKGDWELIFDGGYTIDFYVTATQKREVAGMYQQGKFPYYWGPDFECVSIPFKSPGVSAYFLLPAKTNGLDEHLKTFKGSDFIQNILPKMRKQTTDVYLPKFKVESTHEFHKILPELGIKDVFNEGADLTGIANLRGGLFVAQAIQKAAIEIDEKGSTAVAADAIEFATRGGGGPNEFYADHPFIYMIVDSQQNILFSSIIRMEE